MTAAPHVDYWLSVASPWTWLGSARFVALAREAGATVTVRPMELGTVFAATGGRLFSDRPPPRQSYRQLDLARWSRRLGVPLNLEPRVYPVDRAPASRLLLAARDSGADVLALSHAVLRAIWAEDRDIADWATLATVADDAGCAGRDLVQAAQHPSMQAAFEAETAAAIAAEVFGAPTYVIDGERFWGQDRLEFLAERLNVDAVR